MNYAKILYHFIASFAVTTRSALRRPVTIQYPKVRPNIPKGWRGREIVRDDTCISCARCMMVCPVEAIDMYHPGSGAIANTPAEIAKLPPGAVGLRRPGVDLSRCIFCGYCEEICPTTPKAIALKDIYELATSEYKSLRHTPADLDPKHLPAEQAEKYLKADTNVKAPPEQWTNFARAEAARTSAAAKPPASETAVSPAPPAEEKKSAP